jgi:ubiquinone/menaquinone biosynthesis C-methylase UbiE
MTTAGTALLNPHKVFAKVGLAKGMRVADLGCGRTGHFVFSAARAVGETGVVYAVEVVKDVLESIRNRIRSEGYDNVQTIWSDIESVGKTAIPAESLDGCFIINVLFMVKDKSKALEEASRLLKKGGFLVVMDWKQKLGNCGPIPEMMVPAEQVTKLAEKIGLKLFDNFSDTSYHYSLIFRKI